MKFTFILGAAASGKSAFAESLVIATGRPRHYVATAQIFDDEMRTKVERHVAGRGPGWTTVDAPLDVPSALMNIPEGEVALVDCATMWLTNHLLADTEIATETGKLLAAIRDCAADVVVVSNEVGAGIVPDNALSRRFREEQGRLNRALAAQADLAVLVAAGLPMVLKGQLP